MFIDVPGTYVNKYTEGFVEVERPSARQIGTAEMLRPQIEYHLVTKTYFHEENHDAADELFGACSGLDVTSVMVAPRRVKPASAASRGHVQTAHTSSGRFATWFLTAGRGSKWA